MKTWLKILIIVVAVVLLFPIPFYYKDGGSRGVMAILYRVTNYNAIHDVTEDGKMTWYVGPVVEIFGIEVYDGTRIVTEEELD